MHNAYILCKMCDYSVNSIARHYIHAPARKHATHTIASIYYYLSCKSIITVNVNIYPIYTMGDQSLHSLQI